MKIPMADQKNFASENDDSLMLTLINCWNKFSRWEDLPYSERDLAVGGKDLKIGRIGLNNLWKKNILLDKALGFARFSKVVWCKFSKNIKIERR